MTVSTDNGNLIADPQRPSGESLSGAAGFHTTTSASSSRSKSFSITPKQQSNMMLDQMLLDWFGRQATAAEKKMFYANLHKLELKFASRSRSSSGGNTTQTDLTTVSRDGSTSTSKNYNFNPNDYLVQFVQSIAPKIMASGDFGGKARDNYNAIQRYAYDMGIPANDVMFKADTIASMSGKTSEQAVKEYYRNQTISMYGSYKGIDRLKNDSTLTLRDVASGLINTYASMMEKDPTIVGLDNSTIQDALINNSTISDLNKKIRMSKEYTFTDRAKAEASDLANSFKRTWGF